MDNSAQNNIKNNNNLQKDPQGSGGTYASANKEVGPIKTSDLSEFLKPASHESSPEISEKVAEAGVEESVDLEKPKITQAHKDAGIEKTLPEIEAQASSDPVDQYPQAQIAQAKHYGASQSFRWRLIQYGRLLKMKLRGMLNKK